jgi:hypothetical protein
MTLFNRTQVSCAIMFFMTPAQSTAQKNILSMTVSMTTTLTEVKS